MLSPNPYDLHFGLMGMASAGAIGGIVHPASGVAFTAQTGLTLDSLYTFQEASGSIDDKAGAIDLAENSTPTYAVSVQGRQGIHYSTADDRHQTASHDPAANPFIAFCVFSDPGAATGSIMGGYHSGTAADGWLVYRSGNSIVLDVRDGASASTITASASVGTFEASTLYLCSIQIDRTAARARIRVKPNSATAAGAANADITGYGTLSGGASHVFGYGCMPFLNPGVRIFYGGVMIDATAEGASVLADLHADLGWE